MAVPWGHAALGTGRWQSTRTQSGHLQAPRLSNVSVGMGLQAWEPPLLLPAAASTPPALRSPRRRAGGIPAAATLPLHAEVHPGAAVRTTKHAGDRSSSLAPAAACRCRAAQMGMPPRSSLPRTAPDPLGALSRYQNYELMGNVTASFYCHKRESLWIPARLQPHGKGAADPAAELPRGPVPRNTKCIAAPGHPTAPRGAPRTATSAPRAPALPRRCHPPESFGEKPAGPEPSCARGFRLPRQRWERGARRAGSPAGVRSSCAGRSSRHGGWRSSGRAGMRPPQGVGWALGSSPAGNDHGSPIS